LNTEKRIFSGVFVGFISFALGFIQAILLVPILLTFWGNETYGIWLVLNAGYIILQTLDSGHQQYIGNEFNIKYFSEKSELQVVLASSLRVAFLIGIFQFLVVFLLILTNTTNSFLGLKSFVVEKEYLNAALIILIISWISSGTTTSILSKLLIPYGYYSKSIWWSIYKQLGSFIVLVIIALNKGSILAATIGVSLFNITYGFIFLIRIKNLIPESYPWWEPGDWKTGWNNFKKSSLLSFSSVIYQFSNSGLIILITNLFSAVSVPIFTTLRTLTNSIVSMTNIAIQPLQPDIVQFRVQKDFKKILDTFNINWIISGCIINIGSLVILPFMPDIYAIWTRGKIGFNLPLFLLLAWSVSIVNFGTAFILYINSMNKIGQNFIIVISKLLLIFGISFVTSNHLGIISIGLGIAIAELFTFVIMPYLFIKHEFKLSGYFLNQKDIFIKILPSLLLGMTYILVYYNQNLIILINYLGLAIMVTIYFYNWRVLPVELRKKIKSITRINNIIK